MNSGLPVETKLPAVPFVTSISPTTNPVTVSLKLTLKGMGFALVGSDSVVESTVVGAVPSTPVKSA